MTSASFFHIEIDELKKRLDKDPDLCLIDVREQDEWDEAHIAQAKHIPIGKLLDEIDEFAPDKSQHIYLHCKAGGRSARAAQSLINHGYTNVYTVDGGIMAWADRSLPLC